MAGRGGWRVLSLLGDGNAVFEKSEGSGRQRVRRQSWTTGLSRSDRVGVLVSLVSVRHKHQRLVRLERVEGTTPKRGL